MATSSSQTPSTALAITARVAPILVVFVATVVAIEAGVDVSERPGLPEQPLPVQLYYAIGLFVLGGLDLGVPVGGPTWARGLLWGAYFLGPAITTTAVAEGALRVANPAWLGRWRNRDHLVIVGMTRVARVYETVARRLEPHRRIEHLTFDAYRTDPRRVRADRAWRVVLADADDLANLGAAWELHRMHPDVDVVAHVGSIALRREVAEMAESAGVSVFNAHELAAAAIFERNLAPHFAATPGQDVVAIVGFGRFGQTVLSHLQDWAHRDVARVVTVDRDAARNVRNFAAQVGLDETIELTALDCDVRDPHAWAELSELLVADVPAVAVLCTDDVATNLQAAAGLRQRNRDARLFVRCFDDSIFLDAVEQRYDVQALGIERILDDALRRDYQRS